MAATTPDITHTFLVGKIKGKGMMPMKEHLFHDCPFYHATVSFPEVPLLPADLSVYVFGRNRVPWAFFVAIRDTGKNSSIWIFSLSDGNSKRKGGLEWLSGSQSVVSNTCFKTGT